MNLAKQKGFTLVEIAIVLVIVGLLIGGVLKGQEMITNAKLKRLESDNAGIAAAMFSYQDRYLQLPGDDDGAVARFDALSAGADGDGDGEIGGGDDWNVAIEDVADWTDATVAEETQKFFAHLRAAGLISGVATDSSRPTNAYGGRIGVQNTALAIAGTVTVFGTIEGAIAKILENRLDDGKPNAGRVQAVATGDSLNGSAATTAGTAASSYADNLSYDMAFRL